MKDNRVTFRRIEIGSSLPRLTKKPTPVSLFMFSSALWITHRIHYDLEFARAVGLRGLLVQGPLQASYLIQLVTEWLGDDLTLSRLSYRHHGPAFAGDVLTCTGIVKDKRVQDKTGYLDIEWSITNQNDEKITSGKATVCIPYE